MSSAHQTKKLAVDGGLMRHNLFVKSCAHVGTTIGKKKRETIAKTLGHQEKSPGKNKPTLSKSLRNLQ